MTYDELNDDQRIELKQRILAHLEMFDDPETGKRVPRIVVPVAPEDDTEGEDNGD